jgi:hypothetical protein
VKGERKRRRRGTDGRSTTSAYFSASQKCGIVAHFSNSCMSGSMTDVRDSLCRRRKIDFVETFLLNNF